MNKRILFTFIFIPVLFSCSSMNHVALSEPIRVNPLIVRNNGVIDFANLQNDDITGATQIALSDADQVLEKLYTIPDGQRTFDNTLLPLDNLYNIIENVWSPAYLMGSVHSDKAIRDEGLSSSSQIQKYLNGLQSNEKIFNAVQDYSKTVEAKQLHGYKKKYLDDALMDFKRAGFGLDPKKRAQVKNILDEITDIGLLFNSNISSFQDTLFVSETEIKGMPDSYKKERLLTDGRYAIDLSYPSYRPFMRYAQSDEMRKKLQLKFLNRAADSNLDVLNNLISKRGELVELLGYNTYAEYRTENRMAKNPETVWKFENDLKSKLRTKAELDYQRMLDIKSEFTGQTANVIQYWESSFYENLILFNEFQIDEEEVKQYFEIHQVIEGLFNVSQRLFGVYFKQVNNPSVWHPDVEMYEVYNVDDDQFIGRFYLDLYPRENKYGHAAAFSVTMGKQLEQEYQHPITALVCNFPRPSDEQPSLLSHDNVETFFHEFGHLIHGVLTKSPLMAYAGTSVARDFVEAPSQMLENWIWEEESLSLFAKHYQTGEPIPTELLNKMVAAKNVNSGLKTLQQVYYGILDFTLHDGYNPDDTQSTTDIVKELQNSITLYPYVEGSHFQAAFGHLNGYGAGYYGYLWSLVYAQDMYSVFERNGIFDESTGLKYRRVILEKGGTENPLDLVIEFIGREPNNEAFLKSLGL